jgi:hypothetical protein
MSTRTPRVGTQSRRAGFMRQLVLLAIPAAALAGCMTPQSTTCLDGRVCPPNTLCDVANHACITPADRAACTGHAEGSPCSLAGASGMCRQDVCRPFVCGDGARSAAEACDGEDLGGQTCAGLGFYGQTTGLACSKTCMFDTSGCLGRCGDGQINGPDEACDGAPPLGKTCQDYGYDRGFLGCTALCSVSFSGCEHLGWQEVRPDGRAGDAGSVWGANYHDVYATWNFNPTSGDYVLMHWDGSSWSDVKQEAPVAAVWVPTGPIWGTGSDDVWVGMSDGLVHWDGRGWSVSIDKGESVMRGWGELVGGWGSGPNDVYRLGETQPGPDATLVHWDGKAWSSVAVPPCSNPQGIWGTGASDVFIFGGPDSVLHFDGSAWQESHIADGFVATRIWGLDPSDVYALGTIGTAQHAYRWDGTSWGAAPDLPDGTTSIGGSDPNDIFAAQPNGQGGSLDHWTGEQFLPTNTLGELKSGGMNRFTFGWGDSAADTYFFDGNLYQPGPAEWFQVLSVAPDAIWGLGDDVFVSSAEALVHVTTKDAKPQHWPYPPNGIAPRRIWGSGVSDLWGLAIGGGQLVNPTQVVRWSGTEWSVVATDWSATTTPFYLDDIGGTGPNDVWVVGTIASHWDGQRWSDPIQQTPPMTGIWARSAADVYAVAGTAIQRWDGTRWNQETFPGRGVFVFLDVWGSEQGDVYAVAEGAVLHLGPDNQWTVMMNGKFTEPLSRIAGSSPGNVFARGASRDLLYHLRSGTWETLPTPDRLPPDMVSPVVRADASIWVTPSSVFLGGLDSSGQPGTFRLDLSGVDCSSHEWDCRDGWDNDCDGLADGADPDCAGKVVEQCANLVDDDSDGLIDCNDPDCANFPSCANSSGH